MLPADNEEEDGADGEEEEEDGQDDDGDEVGVKGVVHGGGDDGGDGEGGLEEGEVAQRCLPVLKTALDLWDKKLSGTHLLHHQHIIHISSHFDATIVLLITFLRISRPTAVSVIIGLK